MLRIFVFLILACMPLADSVSEEYAGASFKRANLIVADLDRALEVYQGVLGMTLDSRARTIDDSYVYPLFGIPKTATLHFALLSAGPDQTRTLGLIEVTDMSLPERKVPYTSSVVFRVRNLPAVIAELESLGVTALRPNVSSGRDGASFVEQAFVDHDGNVVLLYEIGGQLPASRKSD